MEGGGRQRQLAACHDVQSTVVLPTLGGGHRDRKGPGTVAETETGRSEMMSLLTT